MNNSFLKVAEQLSTVRKQEVVLPIARKQCVVEPLKVGDDASIRTSVLSPSSYDDELVRLLFKRSTFISEEDKDTWSNFEIFTKELSNIDKMLMVWALYKATYKTLGVRNIECPHCGETQQYKVNLDDLIQEDSITLWDKTIEIKDEEGNVIQQPIKFNEYTHYISIEYDNSTLKFGTRIPSIYDNNKILRLITPDELRKNMEISGMPYSRSHQLCLLTRNIIIVPNNDESKQVTTDNLQDILIAFEKYFNNDIYEKFINEYNKEFIKYLPKFYTIYTCPSCGKDFDYAVGIEQEFFRRCLYGEEEPE